MIVPRYDKTRKRMVYDIRLENEFGKMQFFPFGHTSKTLAKEYQEKLRNQIREWRAFPERKLREATFSEFVRKEYLPKHARGLSRERDYKSICDKLCREKWADQSIKSIVRHDVEPYLTRRYNEVSVYMANREFTILKGIFTKAEQWQYRLPGYNPCRGVKMRKETPRMRILSKNESDGLLEVCRPKKGTGLTEAKAEELRDMIEIALETGPRKEELLNLKVEDINLETGMVRYEGKGGKIRFVPLNSRVREILEGRVRGRKKGYIFGTGKTPPKDFKRAFKSACERAKIDKVRIHDLRRTFGSRCAMAGVPPKTLQKWMGHESIETTMKYYVQIPEDFERDAIEKLVAFRKK